MDRKVPVGIDSIQSHLDYLSNTVFINLVHAEGFDAILLQDAFLGRIDVPETNVYEAVSLQHRLDPGELRLIACDAKEEGHRHAVDVSCGIEYSISKARWAADLWSCEVRTRITGSWSVDVGMGINPHNAGVGVNSKDTGLGRESAQVEQGLCSLKRSSDRAHCLGGVSKPIGNRGVRA